MLSRDERQGSLSPSVSSRQWIARDVTEALGQVPIVRLNRMGSLCQRHELTLKLEACNPSGSIKDKNAAHLVKAAMASGRLRPGGTIIESSSGNFGIGLAAIGAALGFRVIIVIDAKTPPPVRRMLRAYGAEFVEVDPSEADRHGSLQRARIRRAESLAREISGSWYVCQHQNPANPDAHAQFTALEIEAAFGGPPDVIVVGVSTAGQIAGIQAHFATGSRRVRFVAVDVAGSAILGTARHAYKMTGLGLSFAPPCFDPATVDSAYAIDDALAFSVCHLLASREGLLLGASTGAIVAAGLAYAATQPDPQRILMINPDRGDRYLETVYDLEWLRGQGIRLLGAEATEHAIARLQAVPRDTLLKGPAD